MGRKTYVYREEKGFTRTIIINLIRLTWVFSSLMLIFPEIGTFCIKSGIGRKYYFETSLVERAASESKFTQTDDDWRSKVIVQLHECKKKFWKIFTAI